MAQIKSEVKEETLQPIPQKFKRLKEIIIDNHTQKIDDLE